MEFPISFPWRFGDPALLEAEDIDGTDEAALLYERRVSLCEEGIGLLLGQFATKPRIRAVACAILDAIQDKANATWQLHTERWIDTAVGKQLDGLGSVVDFPRAGRLDTTYRALLKARALALRSDGSWPALVAVLDAMGVTVTEVTYEGSFPAGFVVRITETLPTGIVPLDVFTFLEQARAAGIRMTVIAPVATEARTFRVSDAAGYPVTGTGRGLGDVDNPGSNGSLAAAYASSPEV